MVVTDPPVVGGDVGGLTVPPGPTTFTYAGELTQGGWLRGMAPAGTLGAWLDDVPLVLDLERGFFAALDRDAPAQARLRARLVDGRIVEQVLQIAPRAWDIQHVDASPTGGVPSASYMERRRPELDAIIAARAQDTRATGWQQDFIWPVAGRISGRFGSQRVYRGEPGSYHSGLDIAPGAGTPYVAPADGTVVLVADRPFSLEGNLLIIDHGAGLNSAFLHSQSITVSEGQRVRQGEVLGRVGATGRATGPHLHWSLMWRGRRLDPLLFLPPPPG
ncbi:M23 family metallopeptidase [Croceibacterium sp. TMG7-5b_MA50]|uniref:M23 family metallopeptidase n=1 Tax=Croceibacterium sp. TMG7-5b_MA50 TaxID=3121290 RepID=UPI00322157A3